MKEKHRFCLPCPINDGLATLQHQIDHDRRHVAERIVPFLSRADDVVGHRDHVFDAMHGTEIAQNLLGGELPDPVGILGLRLLVLGERRLESAVARH